jgi:hypothetical protein
VRRISESVNKRSTSKRVAVLLARAFHPLRELLVVTQTLWEISPAAATVELSNRPMELPAILDKLLPPVNTRRLLETSLAVGIMARSSNSLMVPLASPAMAHLAITPPATVLLANTQQLSVISEAVADHSNNPTSLLALPIHAMMPYDQANKEKLSTDRAYLAALELPQPQLPLLTTCTTDPKVIKAPIDKLEILHTTNSLKASRASIPVACSTSRMTTTRRPKPSPLTTPLMRRSTALVVFSIAARRSMTMPLQM